MNIAGKHVAVFPFPFASHAAAMTVLVPNLAMAAPEVKFSIFNTAQWNRKTLMELKEDKIDNVKLFDVWDGLPEGFRFRGNPQEPVDLSLDATPGNFESVVGVAEGEIGRKISCLVTDAFLWFACQMSYDMRVPWIPLWAASPYSLRVHIDTDIIRQKMEIGGDRDIKLEWIPGFAAISAADLPEGIFTGDSDSVISCCLQKTGNLLPEATAVAVISFEELDSVLVNELKSKLKKILYVGPPALTLSTQLIDPYGCMEWLDKHETSSVVYISFGSVITLPPHELVALAEVLEESDFPFLWSFSGNVDEQLPKGLLQRTNGNGKVVPWAPQVQILNHSSVGVSVTHCGWNSISESIVGAVPTICRPFFGDQKMNMRIVQDIWKTGLAVEDGKFTKTGTKRVLEIILLSEEGKRMKERIKVHQKSATKAAKSNGSIRENLKVFLELISK